MITYPNSFPMHKYLAERERVLQAEQSDQNLGAAMQNDQACLVYVCKLCLTFFSYYLTYCV